MVGIMNLDDWSTVNCHHCVHGIRFNGYECTSCNGMGTVYITPSGRLMDYPGGHFIGRLTKNEFDNLRLTRPDR